MNKFLLGLIVGLSFLGIPVYALSIFQVPQGGTGVGSVTAGNLIYGDGVGPFGNVATTTASCSGNASCSPFTVIGNAPITISASGGSGNSFAWPFTAQTYGVSTSTTVGFLNGLFSTASSTFSSNIFLSNLGNGLLKTSGGTGQVSVASAGTDYQAPGNYITALTGDVTASGPGSVAATLATVNSNVGTFTNANVTVNGKGLITAITSGAAGSNSFSFPFTVNTGYNSTSTVIGFNGLFSTASSTFSSNVYLPLLPNTFLTTDASGKIVSTTTQSISTSTPTVGSSLTYTGTLGDVLGGTSGTLSLNTANTNTWSVLQNFLYSSTTGYASFANASSTNDAIGTLTLPNITSTQCLHSVNGIVSGTGSDCGSGSGGTYPINSIITSNASGALIATSSQLTVGSLLATSTIGTATSTFAHAVQIGSTARDNILAITANRTYASSASVGGLVNITNTNNLAAGLTVFSNAGVGRLNDLVTINNNNAANDQRGLNITQAGTRNSALFNCTNTTKVIGQECVAITDVAGANTSTLGISGSPLGLGLLKFTFNGVGNANSSMFSGDASVAGYLGQGVFIDSSGGGWTQSKILNLRANGTEFMTFTTEGLLGLATTTPKWQLEIATSTRPQIALSDTTTSNNLWTLRGVGNNLYIATSSPTTFATSSISALTLDSNGFLTLPANAGVGCGQFDANGKLTNTGSACGSGGGSITSSVGQTIYSDSSNHQVGTSTIFISTNSRVGIASTTPWGMLSLSPNNIGNAPEFVIASSSVPHFIVKGDGSVGIGILNPTSPQAFLSAGSPWFETQGDIYSLGNIYSNSFRDSNNDAMLEAAVTSFTIGKGGNFGEMDFYGNGGSVSMVEKAGSYGIGTSTPRAKLDVNGSVVFEGLGTSYATTTSLGGGSLLAGACSSVITTIGISGLSSSTAIVTTPRSDPGDGFDWNSIVMSANSIKTRVCAEVAGTPTASIYNLKIIN